jgi:hypothetical protein
MAASSVLDPVVNDPNRSFPDFGHPPLPGKAKSTSSEPARSTHFGNCGEYAVSPLLAFQGSP